MASPRHFHRAFAVAALFIFCAAVQAAYRIPLTVRTGFYERKDAIVRTTVDFRRAADSASLKLLLITDDGSKEIDYWFEPQSKHKGNLTWILAGTHEAMTELKYELRFNEGQWSEEATGSRAVAVEVKRRSNLIPNGSFEDEDPAEKTKQRTIWKGKRQPTGWFLNDFAYANRKESGIKSICRLSEEEAVDGEKSVKFVTEQREDKLIRGYAYTSVFFPLKPKTKYTFSYQLKITDRQEGGGTWKVVQAEVQFMDEKKQRVHPKNYAINRLQLAYSTTRNPKEKYLDKWVKITRSMVTPEEARLGRVWVTTDIHGTVYFDDMVLVEQQKGEAVQVEVGEVIRNDER